MITMFVYFSVIVNSLLTVLLARNHGLGAGLGNLGPHLISVVSPVSQHVLSSPQVRSEQRRGLRAVACLASRQGQLSGSGQRITTQVQLAAQPAARAAKGLRPVFLSAPAACWCARTVVESTSSSCNPASSCNAVNTLVHTPVFFQREKRAKTVDHAPKRSSRSRHDMPHRMRQSTASTNKRVSTAVTSRVWTCPGSKGARRAHCASVSRVRSLFRPKATP